jgi:hypothetical protein
LLRGIDHGMPPVYEQKALTLVPRFELPELKASAVPLVYVTKYEISMNGAAYTLPELVDRLPGEQRKLDDDVAMGKVTVNSHAIRLALDDGTPWSQVVALVDTVARAGFGDPEFVFALPATTQPPELRSSIDPEIDAIAHGTGNNRASELANLAARVIGRCEPLRKVFGNVATPDGDPAAYIIDHLTPALVECNCSLDVPSLRVLMWRLLRNTYPTSGLALHVDAAAPAIELAGDTPWREASKRLTRETRSISLRVK